MPCMWKLKIFLLVAAVALVSPCHSTTERTLAMIKPDGVRANHTDRIKQIILSEGFSIVDEKSTKLDDVAAKYFYKEHAEKSFFSSLIQFMTSGPVHPMILEREDAIKKWRALMGPTDSNKARIQAPDSIRAKFGTDGEKNCVHGSDAPEPALQEIAFFFGENTQASKQELEPPRTVHEEL